MRIDWSTLVLQLLNFAILMWLLQRFLYRPMLRMIDARRASIAAQYAEARNAENAARDRLAALEARRTAVESERASTLKAAAAEADKQLSIRRAEAEHDARTLMDQTHEALAQERAQLLAEARAAAFELGAEITHQLLARMPASLRTQAWLEQLAQHLESLPQTERDELTAQLARGSALTLVTALPLSATEAERWRAYLRRILNTAVTVEYIVDPHLIAGAQLRFPSATLDFTPVSVLAALRAEVQIDGNPH